MLEAVEAAATRVRARWRAGAAVRARTGAHDEQAWEHESAADDEAQLAELARGGGRLRRALARVAGRMVAVRGWERLGFARLGDYAAERAGVSARELRDLAAVDRALAALREVEAALVAGEIGWTQARLLCRAALPGDERAWLAAAVQLSARALAREVRKEDRAAREADAELEDGPERVGVVLRCTPEVRARWWRARQLARRVAGRALSGEAFAEALAAEVSSAVPLDAEVEDAKRVPCHDAAREWEAGRGEDARAAARGVGSPAPACTPGSEPADAAPAFLAALERDLESADAFELDARLCRALRLEAQRTARVAEWLERVVARRAFCWLGFGGLDAYAEERLGMAPSRARALLRVARAGRACPALREAFAAGRLSWVQAHAIVPVLFEPGGRAHGAAWVAHAQRVSVRRLRDEVEAALALGVLAPGAAGGGGALQTGAIARRRAETARIFFAAEPEVAHLFHAVLATVQRRLERLRGRPCTQSDALDAMLAHALAAWGAEGPLAKVAPEHRVFARDGWRCTVPGCSSYRNLHGHHIVFRSAGGSDELANLTTLCAWHHLRGVHAGTVQCSGAAPEALHFELGVRRGRPPLLAYGPREVRLAMA